jgi:surfactin synthase thioesterase subunit
MQYKLFCIPYAGGSAAVYYSWKKHLPTSVEMVPIELAGRGNRLKEPFYESMKAAVGDVFSIIREEVGDNDEYAVLGHSMGSWIAFEVAQKIFSSPEIKKPCHLFFSGNYPPHYSLGTGTVHLLPEKDFQQEVMKIGGTPKIIFENEDLRKLFSPIIRADYKLLERYNGSANSSFPCDCDVTVLCGKDDNINERQALEWERYAGKRFSVCFFEGGHFFINEAPESVADCIAAALNISPAASGSKGKSGPSLSAHF